MFFDKLINGIESEMEICPDCRGLCGKANADVTVFYPCQRCGGNGSIEKAKPQPNDELCNVASKTNQQPKGEQP